MSFPISSLEIKYCKSTKNKVLDEIEICMNCKKIPLPAYRSTFHQNNIYCKTCFDLENFDSKTHVIPSKNDIKRLEKLVISCKFFEKGCEAKYQIKSLESLIIHENKCVFNNSTLKLKETHLAVDSSRDYFCTKCSVYYNKTHECISDISKSLKLLNNEVILLKQEKSAMENQTQLLETKIASLIENQTTNILSLLENQLETKIASHLEKISQTVESNII